MNISTHLPTITTGYDINSNPYYVPVHPSSPFRAVDYGEITPSHPLSTEIETLRTDLQNLRILVEVQNAKITELENKLRIRESQEGSSTLEIL